MSITNHRLPLDSRVRNAETGGTQSRIGEIGVERGLKDPELVELGLEVMELRAVFVESEPWSRGRAEVEEPELTQPEPDLELGMQPVVRSCRSEIGYQFTKKQKI